MINKSLKINQDICNPKTKKVPIRDGFGEGLLQAGRENERVVGICADLTESTRINLFAKEFPERFVQVGVAEQNLVTVASGMAAMGKIPFVSSYAVFSPGRNWEQIRTTIAYNNVPVKIIGSHAGVSVGPDGATHQALEDIALMRVLPNMTVLSPCDAIEAKKATIEAAKTSGPVYIRLARNPTEIVTSEETPFEIGKAQRLYESENPKVGLIATGAIVAQVLKAACELEKDGIGSIVLNVSTIKPIDEREIISVALKTKNIVTIEEHQIAGGLGSAVSEVLSQNHPTLQRFIAIDDQFGQSGTQDELLSHYGLDSDSIFNTVSRFMRGM